MDTHVRSDDTENRGAFDAPPAPSTLSAAADAPAWAAVDGYEIREVTRRTPTNDVFLAYYRPAGTFRELVVVERVPGVDQGALRQTIEAEAATARALIHVGIAPVEDVGLTRDGRLYVATGRPVGRPLHAMLAEDGRLPVLRAFELGHTLVTAIAVAHERGMVHGWLTPDSVIVVPPRAGWPERVIVLGFGTAAARDAGLTTDTFSSEQFPYMSPERAAGDPPSFRADVFGLGSMLLAMLTGSAPSVVRTGHVAGEAPDVEGAPRDIEQLLQRARAADPAARYASASELGTALWTVHNAWFAARSGETASDLRASETTGSPGRRRALIAAGVVGMFAGGAGVRLWQTRNSAELAAPLVTSSHVAAVAAAAPTPVMGGAMAAVPGDDVVSALARVSDSAVASSQHSVAPRAQVATAPTPSDSALSDAARRPTQMVSVPRPATQPQAAQSHAAQSQAAQPAPVALRAPAVTPTPTATIAAALPGVTTSSAGDVTAAGGRSAVPAPTDAATSESDVARGARAAEVLAMVSEYGSAISARDLGRLERLYPTMTDQQRRGWQTFFSSVADLRAPLTVEQITVAGATAQVRVRAAYEYENLRPHHAERSVVNYKLTLTRDGSGWRIHAVE